MVQNEKQVIILMFAILVLGEAYTGFKKIKKITKTKYILRHQPYWILNDVT